MKIVRGIISFSLIFCIIFTIFIGVKKIGEHNERMPTPEYKGIITLWHVDGFEGGVGSRKQFLLRVSREFEKLNQGVLVMIINHTFNSIKENFDKGIRPDLISFSNGADVSGLIKLKIDRKISAGLIGEKTFATAWCRGGYVLIKNPNIEEEQDRIIVSQGEYTQPLIAMQMQGLEFDKIELLKPLDAYTKFVEGKTKYFLGTQRDIVRLNNRGLDFESIAISEFNDLYQYIGLTSQDEQKAYYSNKFIEYLVSDKVQNQLNRICMLSPFIKTSQSNSHLQKLQNTMNNHSISAFLNKDILLDTQRLSMLALKGDKNALNKIKNMLI